MDDHEHDHDEQEENASGEPGARGGKSENADTLPAAPAEDDTPLGDTDQHSDVSSDRNT